MIKLIVFDLDDTLAPVGKPIPDGCLEQIKKLYSSGIKIAVCSGKSVSYLSGFFRQAGLPDLIMCGENGLTYQFGSDFPPVLSGSFPVEKSVMLSLETIKKEFSVRFEGQYWCQKNEYEFTAFPFKKEYFPPMAEYLDKATKGTGLKVYHQPNCFDVLPEGIDKGSALEYICVLLGIDKSEVLAVGDHRNDYPMFEKSGFSIGIDLPDTAKAEINVKSLEDGLEMINRLVKQ